ncbi:aspartic peptidase domain-containing protein [Entophlyctis helioformis]|nr:aspartic peptidase domain-containing protein [Entophlyctis helioformis]
MHTTDQQPQAAAADHTQPPPPWLVHSFPFVSKSAAGPADGVKSVVRLDAGVVSLPATAAAQILIATVQLGTPPKSLAVNFDTGSAVFWVRGTSCRSARQCGQPNQQTYDPRSSSTYAPLGNQSEITTLNYADGSRIQCLRAQDTLTVGGIQLLRQPVCVASDIQSNSIMSDGLIGLAPPGLFEPANVMSTMNLLKPFKDTIVSFWYNGSDSMAPTLRSGVVTFGGVDTSLFTGTIGWSPINMTSKYWTLPLTSIALPGGQEILTNTTSAIIDTGTTITSLPTAMFNALNAAMFRGRDADGLGTYVIDCGTVPQLRAFNMTLGGVVFKVLPREQYFRYGVYCVLNFSPSATLPPVLGSSFLRNHYTAFDYGGRRVGFATPVGGEPNVFGAGDAAGPGAGGSGASGGGKSDKAAAVGLRAMDVRTVMVVCGSLLLTAFLFN